MSQAQSLLRPAGGPRGLESLHEGTSNTSPVKLRLKGDLK
jgi:hypothetical protein